jgi:hypothetical protein
VSSEKFPNGPPKTYQADIQVDMTLGIIAADHQHHALELVEELVEVMAQNSPYVLDVKITSADVKETDDVIIEG